MALLTDAEGLEAARRILEKTTSAEQAWDGWEGAVGEYVTHTDRFAFFVRSRDNDDEAPYIFEIWRSGSDANPGVKVLQLETVPNDADRNRVLSGVFTAAKTSALGLGNVKDDLFSDLG